MGGGWLLMWRREVRGGGGVAMETHRGAGETVAVGGDDSTLAPCE